MHSPVRSHPFYRTEEPRSRVKLHWYLPLEVPILESDEVVVASDEGPLCSNQNTAIYYCVAEGFIPIEEKLIGKELMNQPNRIF